MNPNNKSQCKTIRNKKIKGNIVDLKVKPAFPETVGGNTRGKYFNI